MSAGDASRSSGGDRACAVGHEALVAALQTILARHDDHAVRCGFRQCGCADCVTARAALRLAEGQEPK